MAVARCSSCGINYPLSVLRCHLCGRSLSHMDGAEPDVDWQQRTRNDAGGRDEDAAIVEWRLGQLLAAGYDLEDAEPIAARWHGADLIDLHDAVDLVAAGCAPGRAAAILL